MMAAGMTPRRQPWLRLMRLFLCALLAVAFVLTMLKLRRQLFLEPGFALSDWLIPYAGQFVRRGLGGELLWFIESWLHLPMAWTVALVSIACYALLTATAMRLVLRLHGLPLWLLVLSPATAFFAPFEAEAVARKEILLLAIPALLLWREPGQAPAPVWRALLLAALTLLLFLHEGMIFFMPLLGVFVWHAWGGGAPVRRFLLTSGAWLAAVTVVIALLNLRYPADPQALCDVLALRHNLLPRCSEPMMTAVSWLAVPPSEVWALAAGQFDLHRLFSILAGIVLCALPFLLLRRGPGRDALLALLAVLPLFILTLDWGRWLHVSVMLLLAIHAARALPETRGAAEEAGPATLPALAFGVVLMLLWLGSWQLVHCCMLGVEPGALGYLAGWPRP